MDSIAWAKRAALDEYALKPKELDKVLADAWDEGYIAASGDALGERAIFVEDADNPYREEQSA